MSKLLDMTLINLEIEVEQQKLIDRLASTLQARERMNSRFFQTASSMMTMMKRATKDDHPLLTRRQCWEAAAKQNHLLHIQALACLRLATSSIDQMSRIATGEKDAAERLMFARREMNALWNELKPR